MCKSDTVFRLRLPRVRYVGVTDKRNGFVDTGVRTRVDVRIKDLEIGVSPSPCYEEVKRECVCLSVSIFNEVRRDEVKRCEEK